MEKGKVEIFSVLNNKFSLEVLFSYSISSFEYNEQIKDPISNCLSDFKHIKFILELGETKSPIFFFFFVKLFTTFFMK